MIEGEPEGATPVDADEAEDLLPSHIHTRDELNEWEQANILEAATWVMRTRAPALQESTIRQLHHRMFDQTWAWAGKYRKSDKNMGVHWATIAEAVRNLIDDGRFWMEHHTFGVEEAALRLHHRLVQIHPFPNGNGRHGRLWCDLLLRQNGRPAFEWKNRELDRTGDARRAYIRALQAADGGDYQPLFSLILDR